MKWKLTMLFRRRPAHVAVLVLHVAEAMFASGSLVESYTFLFLYLFIEKLVYTLVVDCFLMRAKSAGC